MSLQATAGEMIIFGDGDPRNTIPTSIIVAGF